MKRKRLPPDNRLNWRDPDMPVLRLGFKDKELTMFQVPSVDIHIYYYNKMINHPAPSYVYDPSYWWSKKK